MTFHTCFRASKSTARHLNMWYYNHRCVRASGMPEYCLVMQLHSIMVMWYSCSIHLVVCITSSVERDNPDSHLEFQTVTGLRVLHEGACLWSCVFRWVWSAGQVGVAQACRYSGCTRATLRNSLACVRGHCISHQLMGTIWAPAGRDFRPWWTINILG